ncbi:hypothetical protein Tsp_05492 [Trichinella spiralis]|uniref:hypothetical protein n=1 Tax=Trichinella spiralis TaxID=6334 RepID=UPI0001EFD9A4|nr:hypothetical protein Tsp_05492 [Trichinella spiralis]
MLNFASVLQSTLSNQNIERTESKRALIRKISCPTNPWETTNWTADLVCCVCHNFKHWSLSVTVFLVDEWQIGKILLNQSFRRRLAARSIKILSDLRLFGLSPLPVS